MASPKKGLDFSTAMHRLAADVVRKVPELGHIRLDAVAFSVTHARTEGEYGQFAKIVPMRFEGGSDVKMHKRRRFRIPPLVIDGRTILYVIYYCMPKFQNLPFEDKLLTVLHELYHISPEFNGDIRRFPGRNYAHGSSRKSFNDAVKALVDAYLAAEPDPDALSILTPTAEELLAEHGKVTALRIPVPKLIPLEPKKRGAGK